MILEKRPTEFDNWFAGSDGHIYHKKGTRASYYYKKDMRKFVRLWCVRRKLYFWRTVPRLICSSYHGDPTFEPNHANHKNGDQTDDRPTNLEWTTPSENLKHAFQNQLISKVNGSDHPASKITHEQAEEIIKMRCEGVSLNYIAEKTGVKRDLVRKVVTGRTWKIVYIKYVNALPEYKYVGKWAKENIELVSHEALVYPIQLVASKYKTDRNTIRDIAFRYFSKNDENPILKEELRVSYLRFYGNNIKMDSTKIEELLGIGEKHA